MKTLKNASLVLLSGLLLLTLAVISCSKDSGGSGPSISSITPSSALTGADIAITGNNLSGSTVTIQGISASVRNNTSTSLTTTIPAGASAGVQEVKVTNSEGTAKASITITGAGAPPTITSITPASVKVGQIITITGTGFANGATVTIATKVAKVVGFTPTTIGAEVPSVQLNGVAVSVITALGTASGNVNIIP